MKVKGFQDTINWYDQNAEEYSKANSAYSDIGHIEAFVSLLRPQAKVLDAGCGYGRDTQLLTERGLEVTGLDISKGLLRVARNKFPLLNFVEGNFLSLPLENETYDGVWSNTSLLHLETTEDVKKALSEFHRVLKKEGVLHILVKAQIGTVKTAIVKDKLSNHERFFQYFNDEEMKTLLGGSNFSLIQLKHYKEIQRIPHGRPEVELLWVLAKKK